MALCGATLALGLIAGCGDDDEPSGTASEESTPAEGGGGGTIKVGVLSDCEGAFGSFFEPTASGFNLALIRSAGAKAAGEKPTDGLEGAKVGDSNIEIVGYGCADDTADKAIEETRRLMEQEDADILVGPLSGDEGIAVANYAKEHPDKTFINGIAGAQDATLKVQAPNFFRFHPDGAQWSAGLGDYAYNTLGWKKAAIVGDDYSFPYTSLAGFVAEYCAIGGNITKRVWAPLGEEDYSSYISQIPEDIDGLYVGIGGSGLINFLKQYKQQRGKIDTEKMMGNVFWDDPLVLKEVGKDLVGGVTSAMTAADSNDPAVASYIEDLKTNYGDEIAGAGSVGVHVRLLHGRPGAGQGAQRGRRRHLRPEGAAGRARRDDAVGRRGAVGRRQARRQPPGDLERVREEDRRGQDRRRRAGRPDAEPASPTSTRRSAACSAPTRRRRTARTRSARRARPRRGWATPRRSTSARSRWQHLRHPLKAPRRSSACGGSAGASAASSPSRASISTSGPASGARSSARTAPGRPRCSTSSRASSRRPPARVELFGARRDRAAGAQARPDGALAHVPDVAPVRRPVRRRQPLPRRARRPRRPLPAAQEARRRRDARARAGDGRGRRPGRQARRARRRALARRAAPARGRHGARRRPAADDARRARRRALARRAREAHRAAARSSTPRSR